MNGTLSIYSKMNICRASRSKKSIHARLNKLRPQREDLGILRTY